MISVDTNVVVRLLTGDDQNQFEKAKALFEKAKIGHPHKAGHLGNRCSAGSRPALVIPLLLFGKAEQLSALHLSRLVWVAQKLELRQP